MSAGSGVLKSSLTLRPPLTAMMILADGLSSVILLPTSSKRWASTRADLVTTMMSAMAICLIASSVSIRRSRSVLASTSVVMASREKAFSSDGRLIKALARGRGSARPVVSMMTRSKFLLLAKREVMAWTVSPMAAQQIAPPLSSMRPVLAPSSNDPSRPMSPNSLTMTANFWSTFSLSRRLRRVVLPAPRKPVKMVTGMRIVYDVSIWKNQMCIDFRCWALGDCFLGR